jgi:serine phosphatase RsbU (regulator of sigma subunit)
MFTTLFFGILDPRNGKLTYANGGHEPPYIIRSGGKYEMLGRTGPAVGAMGDRDFGPLETQLETGDVLFAYTDGVPDCQDTHGGFFGHERLLDLLQRGSTSSDELVDTVEAELHEYSNGATQFDDITLLTVRRAGEYQTAN